MRYIDSGFVYVQDGGKEYILSLHDGTKVRRVFSDDSPEYPESIDLKITNKCTTGCAWCHESSTPKGLHADYEWLMNLLDSIPLGVEIAIGGGDPLLYPRLREVLEFAKSKGILPSITINSRSPHTVNDLMVLKDNVYGVGLSVPADRASEKDDKYVLDKIRMFKEVGVSTDRIVLHGIIHVNSPEQLLRLARKTGVSKVLILGYKSFGFGKKFLNVLIKNDITKYFPKMFNNEVTVAYDTLAVHQIGLDTNSIYYMGGEGLNSFYVDAVNKQFSVASYSEDRYDSTTPNVKEMFGFIRKEGLDIRKNMM